MRKKLTMLLASLFLVLGTAWADAPTPGQRYRLKNVMTGLYMQANGSSNLQLQAAKWGFEQFFRVEAAENDQFYLKSETGANNYVNASGWNAVVGSGDSKTPYTIALVEGEADVYTLAQTASSHQGMIGVDGSTAGSSLYCNKGVNNNGKWQFEPVATPQECAFDPAKTYRIKSEYSGLYMQLINYTQTNGEGAFRLKDFSVVAEGQKFAFEDAGDGKYYLKTVKDETAYYVNQGSWNFYAGSEATTPFTIDVVVGHTAIYSLHQTLNTGYAGNVTTNAVDGTYIYCNQPSLTGNTIWSFEEVVADPNNITEQTQLTNDSYYKISGERGFIFGADGVVKGTNAVSQIYSEGNKDQHFAIIEKEGKFYLYNVGAKKFVVKSGNNTKLVDLPEQPITLEKTSDNNYVWSILLNGTNKINLSSGWNSYGVYTDYNTEDSGNRWLIYKVGTFDSAEALAAFDKVYVTVNYVLGSRETVTKVETATIGSTFSVRNPSTYTTVTSCTAGGNTLTETDGAYSFTVNEATTVTMNLDEALPFTPSADLNSAAWHVMRIRPVRNGKEEFNWVTKGESEPYTFSSERPTTDAGMWAFVGNPIDGFQIYNKAAGKESTLGVNGSNVVVMEGAKTWTVGKCIESGTNLRGFYLYEGTENKYVHEYGGKFQIWNSTSAPTDGGSALVAEPAVVAEATNLYALKSPTGTYFSFVAPTDGTSSAASFQVTPTFFYKEVSGTGYTFEDMGTSGRFIGLNGDWNVGTTSAVWNISAEDADGFVTISRNSGSGNLGHDSKWNAGTGVFTNVGANCNKWQLIPAYPVTIICKNSNGEEIETVKAATIAGTGYSFTIDTKGGTLVSCVADKGTMTETDGTYSFAVVNGATTVTVTLEEPEVPVVFNPTPSKAYALKVKGQELYLNIRTLGIDDPSTSGSNNISLSARPFAAIYFEAGGTEGTWKMKNVNGKYVGASGWNPRIGIDAHDWTIVMEDGVVTIAKAASAYINANDGAVKAGSPLYCDQGTALQFELFDYDDVNFVTGNGREGTIQVKEIHEEGLTKIPLGAGWRLTMEVESNGASFNQHGSSLLAVGSNAFPEKQGYKGFQLYLQSAANGGKLDAVFGGGDHIINNVTYQDNFSLVVEYDGSSNITFTTVNAQGNEATNVLSGSLPEIDVFSYGLPTGINIKSAAIQVFDIMYAFHVGTTPEGENITITYDGEAVKDGQIFYGNELDLLKFSAPEVPGYSWAVVADKAANTLTLNYTQAEVADLQAVKDLVNRIGGAGTADKFMFVHTPWLNSKQETFILGAQDGKIRIEGSTVSAITTGIGWYLNHIAHINIAWNSLNEKTVAVKENGAAYADLSNLPLPSQTETHTSDAKYRYYLNTCTFGYSMTSWTWTRWQQEIDWMALHGINMPLQLVGLEEVWRTFLTMEDANGNRKYGYTDEEAKAFVAGPAFIAWWAMNNLEGWGGTAAGSKSGYNNLPGAGGVQDDAWYARQKKLAKQIVEVQRGLGMQPVIPGWSGMVPTNFADKSGNTTRGNGGNWAGDFVRPLLLNTSVGKDKYAEIAADYYECLHAVMGESQYYSMDPFHEGGGAGTMEDYEALYAAMEAAKAGSQWVIQQWQWSATQKYSLTAVPEGRLIVLDLFSDGSPAFDSYNGYAPQDAVFCAIPNFGGRSGLMGRLQNVTDNYFKFKGKYASIKGIGTAPEAIEQTPVTYDLIYQLPWMNGVKPDVAAWVDNYAYARYGKNNSVVKQAWSLLRQGPLNYGADGIQGPVEDVWAARPNLNANPASHWGKTLYNAGGTYTKERRQMLIDATYKLISQRDILELEEGSIYESNYLYDLVEFGGAVMADYAYDLLLGIRDAKNAAGDNFANDALYKARRDAFLQLILDMDDFRGTNLNFRLGKWTQEARDAAAEVTGATTATPDWYEYNNARTILTTWSSPGTNLNDYSYRSWQGLLKDFYYKRWEHFFDNDCTAGDYKFFEWNWAHGMKYSTNDSWISTTPLTAEDDGHTSKYTRAPEGNTVESARAMLRKYIIPIHMHDGTTFYAYRTFEYDLTGKVVVNVPAGSTVDFTHYFNVPADATISGDFINSNEPVKITAVPVKDVENEYTGTITLADGTTLKNFTVHTPAFNGVYKITLNTGNPDWPTTPVFIQYNENDNVAGYKMVAVSEGLSTDSELDKWFSITPSGEGYTISAQGKYLKTPIVWEYVLFSENKEEAGSYLFDDSDTHDLYKIVAVDGSQLQAWNFVMADVPGNNPASCFTFEKVETYPVSFKEDSLTTVYLPFNVILPEGVEAYDVCGNELVKDSKNHAEGALEKIADSGNILKAGTPTVLKGKLGTVSDLIITTSDKNAKGGLPHSVLRGSYEKHALTPDPEGRVKKFVLHQKHFDELKKYLISIKDPNDDGNEEEMEVKVEMPANTCWVESDIDADQIGLNEGSFLNIDGWLFFYDERPNGLVLTGFAVEGDAELVIPSTYTVNDVEREIIAISKDFLYDNQHITSVTFPRTMTDLGTSTLLPIEEFKYDTKNEGTGAYPGMIALRNLLTGTSTWRMTVGVRVEDPLKDFNEFGSSILTTKEETLEDDYSDGSMQLYLKNGHDSIVFKLDVNDDRYTFNYRDENGMTLVNDTFTFVLDNDGSGGYAAKVIFENGKTQSHAISADAQAELKPFRNVYFSMPQGFYVTVKVEEKLNTGLFVGCSNLREIKVEEGNDNFSSIDGVLYNKAENFIIRFPEGGADAYDINKKVVRVNPGALHDVEADITFHSNPQILHVKGHEQHMKSTYYLSLEDVDPVNFVSNNVNTFKTVRYVRPVLARGKYGTIMLPFVPNEESLERFEFFEFLSGNDERLFFTQVEVDDIEPSLPYLYRPKEYLESDTVVNGGETTIKPVGDSVHIAKGVWKSVGCYRTDSVKVKKYPGSYFYTFSVSKQEFNKITETVKVRPYRSFFVMTPKDSGSGEFSAPGKLTLRFSDGRTTEITPDQVEGWVTPEYYNLMGCRVLNPTNGVYIVDGKKVIMK